MTKNSAATPLLWLGLVPLAVLLASCEPYYRATHLDVDIAFRNPDGTPAAGEKAYIIEQFGPQYALTDIRHTDANGHIRLNGNYCMKVMVEIEGGGITFGLANTTGSYVADVDPNPDPRYSLAKTWGTTVDSDHARKSDRPSSGRVC